MDNLTYIRRLPCPSCGREEDAEILAEDGQCLICSKIQTDVQEELQRDSID
jgi:hypothetical protein